MEGDGEWRERANRRTPYEDFIRRLPPFVGPSVEFLFQFLSFHRIANGVRAIQSSPTFSPTPLALG